MKRVTVLIICFGLAARGANAQSPVVEGTVSDTIGEPIAQALVVDVISRIQARSDSAGAFRLVGVRRSGMHLVVRRIGFVPAEFSLDMPPESTVLRVSIELTPGVMILDSITVAARVAGDVILEAGGFRERMHERERGAGSSTFVTPEQVERRRPLKVSDLLATIPGLRLQYERNIAIPYGRGGCVMNIWVDGALVENLYASNAGPSSASSFSSGSRSRRASIETSGGIDGFLGGSQVKAIEVYPTPSEVPAQFDVIKNQCGTIVIWTKP